MLSRVADCLYWLSRYVERAENLARIIDVNSQVMLDLPWTHSQQLEENWLPLLACLDEDEAFIKTGRDFNRTSVTEYLVFDQENPNSIQRCLAAARENARTVREQISTEMWEQINRAYLWSGSHAARDLFERNQYEFFQQIKETSQLFQGITDASMLHGEGWDFIQFGKFIERADKTSRVLDDKYHLLSPARQKQPHLEVMEWTAVLRSCSARQAYQRVYVAAVKPQCVADLLLLNEVFPRSVRFCVERIDRSLRLISGVKEDHFSNAAEKLTGRLVAELRFSEIEDFYERGLHDAVDDIQVQLNRIDGAVFQTYIFPARVTEPPLSGAAATVVENNAPRALAQSHSQSQSQSQSQNSAEVWQDQPQQQQQQRRSPRFSFK